MTADLARRIGGLFNSKDLTDFLGLMFPAQPVKVLAKIDPPPETGAPFAGDTFGGPEAAAHFALTENKKGRGVYFQPNVAVPKKSRTKASFADVHSIRALWVDIDCGAENVETTIKRAHEMVADRTIPLPTAIVESGNGIWLWWALAEPTREKGEAKQINQALFRLFSERGGDNCADPCWIARLPGTVNVKKLDALKLAKMRRTSPRGEEPRYSLEDFAHLKSFAATDPGRSGRAKKATGTVAISSPVPVADLSELGLDADNGDWLAAVLVTGWTKEDVELGLPCPPGPKKGATRPDGSTLDRSEAVFSAACELVRRGVAPEKIAGALLNRDWGVSAHVFDQSKPEAYAAKQVRSAVEAVAEAEEEPTRELAEQGKLAGFVTNENGRPIAKHQRNIRLALDRLGVRVSTDLFTARRLVEGLPELGPWLDDAALNRLWLAVDEKFSMLPPVDFFVTVVTDYAQRNAFHPVRDYLAEVQPTWDGKPSLAGWLIDYGGAEDTEFTREVSKLTLVAAARRARFPGSKFDEMLVLEGPQGVGKSSAIETLMPDPAWFSDNFSFTLRDREAIEQLAGRWIIEAPELKGMRKSESETRKAFMSRQTDRGRLAYGRTVTEVPRTCIFIGTTNDERYLTDPTGNRRFWPVRVEGFDVDAIRRDRDQLWAEAATLEAQGHPIRLAQRLWRTAATVQHSRRVEDPWVDLIVRALGDMVGKIDPQLIWNIVGVEPGRRTQADNDRLGSIMRDLGWERKKRRLADYDTTRWAYVRGDDREQQTEIRLELRDGAWVATRELPF